MRLRDKIASIFMFLLLAIQVYKFVMVSFEAFNISVKLPPLMEKLTIFSAVFLAFLLFKEFLEEEFHFEDATVYLFLTIFFFSNVNILLKFVIPEELLVEHRVLFNAIPLVLIFFVLPFSTYVFEKSVRTAAFLILVSIGIIYPIGQLYPLILDKFVTLIATLYTVYAIGTGFSSEGFEIKEVLHRMLEFDEVIVERFLLHPAKESENKLAFYLYAVVLFYIIADFSIYVIPSITGLWVPHEYLEKLGMELERVSLPPVTYLSLLAYVLLVSYPFLKDAFKWEEAWFSLTMLISSFVFMFFPSVVLSPLLSYNGYGVVMLPWDYDYEPILTAFGAISIGVIAGMVFLGKRGIQLRRGLMDTIPLISLSLLLPYIGVYVYSLVYASLSWYRHSPYLIFLMILLFFLILSFVLISLRWISNFIR